MSLELVMTPRALPVSHLTTLPNLDISDVRSEFLSWVPSACVAYYSLEAKPIFEEIVLGLDSIIEPVMDEAESLFFLHQCMIAVEHLVEVQHCDVDTIKYAGVLYGRHVWMARS